MAFEHWYCEYCWNENTVQHKKHAGVTEVKDAISAKHRKKAPVCASMNGLVYVRVGFPPSAKGIK